MTTTTAVPLRFTTDYHPPDALREAFKRWCKMHTHFAAYRRSHMWHQIGDAAPVELLGHQADVFDASLSPDPGHYGPGDLLYQAICEPCQWQTFGTEAQVVEDWHDHALPGWRALPVVPQTVRVRNEKGLTKDALQWITERYPDDMQVPGAPILTERAPTGTRHVPGYSPFGGYDLSHTALTRPSRVQADTRPMQLALF